MVLLIPKEFQNCIEKVSNGEYDSQDGAEDLDVRKSLGRLKNMKMEKMKNVERQKSFKMTRFGEAAQAGKSKFASKNKIFDGMYHLQEHKEEGMEKEEKQEKRINEID